MCFLKGQWGALRLTTLTVDTNLRPNLSWAISWEVTFLPDLWPLQAVSVLHPDNKKERDRGENWKRYVSLNISPPPPTSWQRPYAHMTEQFLKYKFHSDYVHVLVPPSPPLFTWFPALCNRGGLWASWLHSKLQVAACPPPEHTLTDLHRSLQNRSAPASPASAVVQWPAYLSASHASSLSRSSHLRQ